MAMVEPRPAKLPMVVSPARIRLASAPLSSGVGDVFTRAISGSPDPFRNRARSPEAQFLFGDLGGCDIPEDSETGQVDQRDGRHHDGHGSVGRRGCR